MTALDGINGRFGRGAAGFGRVKPDAPWKMQQDAESPSYTTSWEGTPTTKA